MILIGIDTAPNNDPVDTILVAIIIITQTMKKTNKDNGKRLSKIPTLVATPFPPLKDKNTDQLCPIIAKIAAVKINIIVYSGKSKLLATNTAKKPLAISSKATKTPTLYPATLATFVAPTFPLPYFLISFLANIFPN